MFTFLCILTIVVLVMLILVAAMQPAQSEFSSYELQRRAGSGDHAAKRKLRLQKVRADITSILRVKVAFLLVATAFLLVATFGWLLGGVASLIVVLEYGAIARIGSISRLAHRLYIPLEPRLLRITEKAAGFVRLIRSVDAPRQASLGSRQELEHLVDQSDGVLSADEKRLVVHSLSFSDKLVSEVMTPADAIASIKKTEFLGPLTLDELHKSGHSRLPVIAQDIDHVVGILHLENLLALDIKRSVTAERAMDPQVVYIRQDQTLPHALAAFLQTHKHLFVVVNEDQKTVGLLTLQDIIESLIGHKIIGEFDEHQSLRAVASRQPKGPTL